MREKQWLSMIMCSFNVRGLGSRVKSLKIRKLIREEKVDFMVIQETKMDVFPDSLVFGLWGNSDCDWRFLPAMGCSGDNLSIWCKVKDSIVFTFIGDSFVGVCLDLLKENRRCFIVNVYSKCQIQDKKRLWRDLHMS
jgi:mannosylglycoprotein endo-beta-mannosidase